MFSGSVGETASLQALLRWTNMRGSKPTFLLFCRAPEDVTHALETTSPLPKFGGAECNSARDEKKESGKSSAQMRAYVRSSVHRELSSSPLAHLRGHELIHAERARAYTCERTCAAS